MPVDIGTSTVASAGTAESINADRNASSAVRPDSLVLAIEFKAPGTNTGNVYIGMVGRDGTTSLLANDGTYGRTLEPGETLSLEDCNEKFKNFEVDVATNGEKVEWTVIFKGQRTKA